MLGYVLSTMRENDAESYEDSDSEEESDVESEEEENADPEGAALHGELTAASGKSEESEDVYEAVEEYIGGEAQHLSLQEMAGMAEMAEHEAQDETFVLPLLHDAAEVLFRLISGLAPLLTLENNVQLALGFSVLAQLNLFSHLLEKPFIASIKLRL